MNSRPRCFECNNYLVISHGKVIYEEVDYHGTMVKMHKECAKRQEKELTAQLPIIGQEIDE